MTCQVVVAGLCLLHFIYSYYFVITSFARKSDRPPMRKRKGIGQRLFKSCTNKKLWTLEDYQKWWNSLSFIHSTTPDLKASSMRNNSNTTNTSDGIRVVPIKKRPERQWRFVIAFVYEQVFSSPPRSEWNERGGTIHQILKILGISRGSR